MDQRLKPQNLVLISPAPHGSHHVYYSALPVAAALGRGFFIPVRGNLRPGDTIQIQQIEESGGRGHLVQFADTLVVATQRDGVELFIKGGIVDVPVDRRPAGLSEARPTQQRSKSPKAKKAA